MNFERTLIVWLSLVAVAGPVSEAQSRKIAPLVLIEVGESLKAGTPFAVQLKNDLPNPLTVCADFGKSVQTESGQQVAPNPFEVQKWNGRRWHTQLIGTDVGSSSTTISIDAHEAKSFTLQLNASGLYRLKLAYQEGENDTQCPLPSEHAVTATSKSFLVQSATRK